ncbi:alpha/beta fold hydrolase [Phytohabitans suffuscus]|uniref:Alpha/beta hydrolase n=1 Tax=Phytohabitans suffuscus TaxID=624315 RepID=A0A6F8YM59_9ACTN|nr:alpha/beta hydrolase [Phytohabitans suffuscus]BCB87180.1 alpha/beta hydrolase [Phytohabitans suffuscus]
MATATIGDITIGYDDEGTGDALVLVHGHPFDRSMWRPQFAQLSRAGWRVIAPDLRGYGESTVVPGKTTLDVFARDIAGLLDRLGVERFVLGGLSMGGQIVLECHRLFAHRLRGLVLADTSAPADSPAAREARRATAKRLVSEGMGPYAGEVLHKMVSRDAPSEVAAHVLAMMHGTDPEGAAAALRGRAERPDYVAMLRAVAVPALVVVGAEDEFTPLADARLMSDAILDATLVVVEGAAHMPNLERPADFDEALGDFLVKL